MIQKVFSVRDSKALAFLQPFFSSASGSAIRAFSDAVNDGGKSPISVHPEDYILYELGTFDDNSGEMISLSPIKLLGVGMDFVTSTASRPSIVDEFEMNTLKRDKKLYPTLDTPVDLEPLANGKK